MEKKELDVVAVPNLPSGGLIILQETVHTRSSILQDTQFLDAATSVISYFEELKMYSDRPFSKTSWLSKCMLKHSHIDMQSIFGGLPPNSLDWLSYLVEMQLTHNLFFATLLQFISFETKFRDQTKEMITKRLRKKAVGGNSSSGGGFSGFIKVKPSQFGGRGGLMF